MLTSNFKKLMRALLSGDIYGFKDIAGESRSVNPYGSYYTDYLGIPMYRFKTAYCKTSPTYGVYFGTDPTAATESDYKLGAAITSGLSITNPSSFARSENVDAGTVTYSALFTVTNTSKAEIAIHEIGWYTDHTSGSNSELFYIMLDRTVLDEPITIQPGETKYITYELTFRWALILE